MKYAIEFNKKASKELAKLNYKDRLRIYSKIDALSDNPKPLGSVKLAGPNRYYRIRVGDYRVVYKIEASRLIILVLAVGHRREIYRDF